MQRSLFSVTFTLMLGIIFLPAAFHATVELLLLGVIPGTNIAIPFWIIFLTFFGGAYYLVRWVREQPLFIGDLARQEQVARQLARKRVAQKVRRTPSGIILRP